VAVSALQIPNKRSEDPMEHVRRVREAILADLRERKNGRVVERTTRLNDHLVGTAHADAAAKRRLAELARLGEKKLNADQQRDLLLIVLAVGTVSNEHRIRAGARLVLHGDDDHRLVMHQAFPGLMPAILAQAEG
jgi:hypothetical protein